MTSTRLTIKTCGYVLISLMALFSPIESKPPIMDKLDTSIDPLVAMPSEMQHVTFEHQMSNQPVIIDHTDTERRIQYQIQESQLQQRINSNQAEPTNTLVREEPVYIMKPDGQLVQQIPEPTHKSEYTFVTNHGQETPTEYYAEEKHSYPGEILYVQSNDETSRLPSGSQEFNGQQRTNPDLSNVVNMITKSSGLPATILTEIPVKDMPFDVLEKLKRDYGVKVVATRDRPGANLVINCEDSLNFESSVCNKQQAYAIENGNFPQSSPASVDDQNTEDEKPRIPSQVDQRSPQSNYKNDESNVDDVRGREVGVEGEVPSSARESEPKRYENDYAIRESGEYSGQSNPESQGSADESSSGQLESPQTERAESRSNGDPQEGFQSK